MTILTGLFGKDSLGNTKFAQSGDNAYIPMIYGSMYGKNDAGFETIDLVDPDTYVASASMSTGLLSGMTFNAGTLVATYAGTYLITAVASGYAGTLGEYGMKIFVGDTGKDNLYGHAHITTTATMMSLTGIVALAASDIISLRFDDHANPVRDLVLKSAGVTAIRIGD